MRNNLSAITTTVSSHPRPEPAIHQSRTNGSCPEKEPLLADHFEEQERLQWEPLGTNENFSKSKGPPKFEAYMMTGEHILNISRVPQTSLIPKQQKKVNCTSVYYPIYVLWCQKWSTTAFFNSTPIPTN